MSGVRRWESAMAADEVRSEAADAGLAFGHVVGAHDRAAALEAIGQALGFPDWWGRNLDALHDCLRDVPPAVLLWDDWADAPELEPVLDVLEEHAERLTVLLRPPAG